MISLLHVCVYTYYCFLAGYVQGMSDLLAPLLAVMENEVDTFWCFVGFMDTVVSRLGYLVLMGHCREGGREGDTCYEQYCSQPQVNFEFLYISHTPLISGLIVARQYRTFGYSATSIIRTPLSTG